MYTNTSMNIIMSNQNANTAIQPNNGRNTINIRNNPNATNYKGANQTNNGRNTNTNMNNNNNGRNTNNIRNNPNANNYNPANQTNIREKNIIKNFTESGGVIQENKNNSLRKNNRTIIVTHHDSDEIQKMLEMYVLFSIARKGEMENWPNNSIITNLGRRVKEALRPVSRKRKEPPRINEPPRRLQPQWLQPQRFPLIVQA